VQQKSATKVLSVISLKCTLCIALIFSSTGFLLDLTPEFYAPKTVTIVIKRHQAACLATGDLGVAHKREDKLQMNTSSASCSCDCSPCSHTKFNVFSKRFQLLSNSKLKTEILK